MMAVMNSKVPEVEQTFQAIITYKMGGMIRVKQKVKLWLPSVFMLGQE